MARPSVKIEPRSSIFIDTSALVALVDNSDSLYETATAVMAECRAGKVRFFVSELVLVEFLNSLCSAKFRMNAIDLVDAFRRSEQVTVIPTDQFEQALGLYRDRPDKEWSLTDCVSFILMSERGISQAFTSDRHFEQAGFVKLL